MKSKLQTLLSLDGLSVGDAFGAALGEGDTSSFAKHLIATKRIPPGPWRWTDDTHMALSIVEVLSEFGEIEQDALAKAFANRFTADPRRGYGSGVYRLLTQISEGGDWRVLAGQLFDGGSFGNGAAMRAAPIGGYFPNDPERAAQEARKSAVITHAHPEGQAGAIAVAVAAAIVSNPEFQQKETFWAEVVKYVPDGETKDGLILAGRIGKEEFETAVTQLGTGWRVSAQDTVPFCLWCVANNIHDFEAALWTAAAGEGDRDTTCAIVGGIMALAVRTVPKAWIERREVLPTDFVVGRKRSE